jgi:hypothetical protein
MQKIIDSVKSLSEQFKIFDELKQSLVHINTNALV